ncbi:MAG: glycosyltransferase family 4 protein [Chlorobi bacterium]|nr:glycosyltransferase family 4 protein [Chlorobiota bacterium]
MKIVFDARPITKHSSGIGTYSRELLLALVDLIDPVEQLYLYSGRRIQEVKRREDCQAVFSEIPDRAMFHLPYFLRLPRALRSVGADVYHCPEFFAPSFGLPCKMIVTIYDLIPLAIPHLLPRSKKSRLIKLYKWYISRVTKKAECVITISQWSKRDILRLIGIEEGKVRVVHAAPIPLATPIRPKVLEGDGPFVLTIGRSDPYKGFALLVEAFIRAKKEVSFPHRLVITGPFDSRYTDHIQAANDAGARSDVIFTGYVSNSELSWLLQHADLYVHPSLYEGFGLPPLDALACGTPVLSSNRTCLPEILGQHAHFVDPEDPEEFRSAFQMLLTDEKRRTSFVQSGKDHAASYSWRRAAEQTLDIYREVGRGG